MGDKIEMKTENQSGGMNVGKMVGGNTVEETTVNEGEAGGLPTWAKWVAWAGGLACLAVAIWGLM